MVGKAMSFWLSKNLLGYMIPLVRLECCGSACTEVFHLVIGSIDLNDRKQFRGRAVVSRH